jgi:Ran GTPase-activating protein (RanGAP) involved in mRNA processing and transport
METIVPADTAHWRELTEFAHCKPSALAFRALVVLLDTWPADDQAAAIAYADKLLKKWPDAVRLAPWSWCKAASQGVVPPTWPLVRALQLTTPHLSKGVVDLARLAHHADLEHITELEIPYYSDHQELSFLYHRPETFPALKRLRAADKYDDGEVRALADSPLWRTLESFEIENLSDSLVHRKDASRIVPQLERPSRVRHLTLRSRDLMAVWDANDLAQLHSAAVFIRSIDEALALAAREELSRLTSLSIAFRCGFSGSSPFEPFLGNVIEADEAAADAFFKNARLDRLEELAIIGYPMGYWGREGLGRLGLKALIASGLLRRLRRLRLQQLPLGDQGIAALAPALGKQLETLELRDVYCKGRGAAALSRSHCLSSLRHLDLSANRIDAKHFVRMAEVAMPHLESLDLSGPRINPYYWNVGQQPLLDAGAGAWANSANAKRLKLLRFQNCHLTDKALTAIFQSSQLQNLEELDLSHNSFTAAAIAQVVVGSPLWRPLKELGLNNCRLDNGAVEALARVDHAPALRSLQLGYNSIGPKGAAALANWPALARVWHLELHDNVIGDDGLMALARSPYLGRLLELDFEQDCWNSRAFTFNDKAAKTLAASRALPRLDNLFSGCVDEYHGTAYSPGFTKVGLDALQKSAWMRPAFQAACRDFSGISDYMEQAAFDEDAELSDQDFRRHPPTLNKKEAKPGKRRMQQLRSPAAVEPAVDEEKPPEIRPSLPELDLGDEDIIEGLEFRDPTPVTDVSLRLNLSLEDRERPLPTQVGKLLSDTLGSVFKASALGYFETSGSGSRQGDDRRMVDTDLSFSLGIKGDPQPALQLIREALWWVGAPGNTDLDEFPLALTKKPSSTASRLLQLAAPKITRWQVGDEPGYRIDRLPFSKAQRQGIRRILTEAGATEAAEGWVEVATNDGGSTAVCVKYLNDSADFDTLNILADVLTPEISSLIHRLMRECALMLLPMAFAATLEVARTIDCDWPKVEVVGSARALHEVLARGPYLWWRRT